MSSIIDALKKSDAKRPRKNHGLNITMDLKGHSEKKKRWGFYTLIVVFVLILAAVYFQEPDYIWQHLGSAEQTAVVSNSPEQNNTTPTKQTKKLNKPTPQQVQSAVKKQTKKPTVDKQANQSIASEAQKTQPEIVNNQESTAQTDQTNDDNDLKSSQIQKPVQQIDQQLAVTPMKNKQAINAPPENNTVQEQPENKLPQLFELPYSVRKDIPKINLSVHVYDPLVENRMAILNGVPIKVGDSFEEIITIQDITQSGVVLRIQDRDFIILK